MSEIHREKIPATALEIGMFVSELDRPWLGTPFLLEGVLIEEQAQINTLIDLCREVYIDRSLSTGIHFNAAKIPLPSQQTATFKGEAANKSNITIESNLTNTHRQHAVRQDKFSFFDVLKEIKTNNQANALQDKNRLSVSNKVFNIQTQQPYASTEITHTQEQISLKEHLKNDISSIFSGLKPWSGNKSPEQTRSKSDILADHLAKKQAKNITPVEQEIVQAYPVFERSQIATREIFEALAHDKHIDLTNVHAAMDGMVESIERNPDALMWLTKLKQSDNDAYNHAMNTSITMMALANFMSLPKVQVKNLGMAGLLQDIGKAKIDVSLLHKSEKITLNEYEILKKHVEYAIHLLKVTDNIPNIVLTAVSQHHERIDGSGYPNKLVGKNISLMGQLAGIVDTYCALTTDRAYAKGVYNQMALEVIHQLRDTKFSGVLIDQLVQFLGMYPVTSLVELNTGEVGVVIEQNSVRRLLPRVMVLLNADKTKNLHPSTINLINEPLTPNGEPYKILRGLPPNSFGLNPNNYYA